MMQVKRRPFLSSVGLAYMGYMHVIPASQGSGGRGMDRALAKKSYMKALELSKTESSKELGNPSRADQVLSCLSYEALSRALCRLSSFDSKQELQRSNALPPPLSAAERKTLYKELHGYRQVTCKIEAWMSSSARSFSEHSSG